MKLYSSGDRDSAPTEVCLPREGCVERKKKHTRTMSKHTPPVESDRIEQELLLDATSQGIRGLWEARKYCLQIQNAMAETRVYIGDEGKSVAAAQKAAANAIAAYTREEPVILADHIDAKQQALDHLPTSPDAALDAADATLRLSELASDIAAKTTTDQFEQEMPITGALHREAHLMFGGAIIAIDALEQFEHNHPEINEGGLGLGVRDTNH